MKGLNWQALQLLLAAGVNQKADDRALPAPSLAAALDVQFDELGGLQTRKPYSAIGSTIAGGGTISDARRMYANGSELILWTKSALYSWNDQLDRWVFRATHLAVSVDEKTSFATPGDAVDCDRAELLGIVYTCWTDTDIVYVAAHDKVTGAVINTPTPITGVGTRPRLLALATKVLLVWHAGTDAAVGIIYALAIDPTATAPATLTAQLGGTGWTSLLAAANCGAYYDLAKLTTTTAVWVSRRAVTTSYTLATITEALVVTSTTKARVCDGPITVAGHPDGLSVHVIRANVTNIQGDRITVAGLVDVTVNQAIGTVAGTPVSQLTAAYQSVAVAGDYRCYVFWTASEVTTSASWLMQRNFVDTSGYIDLAQTFVRRMGIASRAFDHDGSVYIWGVFAGESSFSGASPSAFRAQLQNTYYLYRFDKTLHGKAAAGRAGGLQPSVGRVPGVALTGGTTIYSWAATERRIIDIGTSGKQKAYDKRAPREVVFEFDSSAARRCVRLGETLYVSGAEILQYDGVGLYEVGYHVFPWYFGIIEVAAGNLLDGVYTYKVTQRWENAKGELDRSTTATHGNVTIAAGPNGGSIVTWVPLYITHKTTTKPVAFEVWRTAVNPPEGAPFYLVTSKDPASLTNPNRYIPNDTAATGLPTFNDELADSSATTKETSPENGDVLENLAPPGAKVIAATDERIFLGAVAGDPDAVWYSKLRQDGQVASFHDTLRFMVPRDGGAITGIAFQQGVCVVFREYATYMFPGDGFDNLGRGQNYGPPQVVSYDVGCRDTDSIVNTPEGIAFQSSKGKYLLNRGWTMTPIGLNVVDYDAEPVLAAHVIPSQHQVRWVTGSRVLMWDYLGDAKWSEWTIASAVHGGVWQGIHHYLLAAGPLAQGTAYTGLTYGLDVETAWIKPNDLQGASACRKFLILGELRSAFYLRVRIAYNYNAEWIDDRYSLENIGDVGSPLQREVRPSRPKGEAFKLRISAHGIATQATLATTANLALLGPVGFWTATLTAAPLGTLGNGITVRVGVGVLVGATAAVEVRDHQWYSPVTGLWASQNDTVGIKITGAPTIAAVEARIALESTLLSVTAAHASPAATVDAAAAGTVVTLTGVTAGGAFAAPTGESLKLTGLGLEVGIAPRLHKRFPRT